MFGKKLIAVALLCAVGSVRAGLIESQWIGGAEGRWDAPENWTPVVVPDNNDLLQFIVVIPGGDGPCAISLARDYRVNAMICHGQVAVRSQHERHKLVFDIPAGLTNQGSLELDDLSIVGNVANVADANLTFGTKGVALAGNLSNAKDALVQVNGIVELAGATVTNDGEIIVQNLGTLRVKQTAPESTVVNAGVLRFRGGTCAGFHTIVNAPKATMVGTGFLWARTSVVNRGTIMAFVGNLLVDSYGTIVNEGTMANLPGSTLNLYTKESDFTNTGRIVVQQGGAVVFTSLPAKTCLINGPNGVISLKGGTVSASRISQSAQADFSGFGGITADVAIDPSAALRLTGTTNLVGNLTIPQKGELAVNDGTVLVSGQTACDGTIRIVNGKFIPQGGFSGGGSILSE